MKAKREYGDKPYNRCLSCPHRKVRCDGPRTSAMELLRWCEFMRDMKEANKLTNAYISEKSGVSIKTIERLMALNIEQDIMRETARRIEDAIIGSSNQYPCILAYEESVPEERQKLSDTQRDLERAVADNKDIRAVLDSIHLSYNAEMQTIRDDAQKKIDFLREQIKRLQDDVDYLRRDNERKGAMIEKYFGLNVDRTEIGGKVV